MGYSYTLVEWVSFFCQSYESFFDKPLVDSCENVFDSLNEAPFACLGHQIDGEEPCIVYANKKACEVFKRPLDQFLGLPSKETATSEYRSERAQFMETLHQKGWSSYEGIRVDSQGSLFTINDALVWHVFDERNQIIGAAAKIPFITYRDKI